MSGLSNENIRNSRKTNIYSGGAWQRKNWKTFVI
jgi:hypothetical protein